MDKVLSILKTNKLRVTPVRKDLLSMFIESDKALSNQDIEERLQDVDRITLYRTLKAFQEKGIIHRAFDGTDTARYAACSEGCSVHAHNDEHLHFHCSTCDNTFCVDEILIPKLEMPKGFTAHKTNIVVDGICENCG